jgi:hypothetical protein
MWSAKNALEAEWGRRPAEFDGRQEPTSCVRGDDGCSLAVGLTAYDGPGEDETHMPRTTPVSQAARERLRDHQAAAAKVVAAHTASLARLDAAVFRRAEVVAGQDALVAAASTEVAAAVVAVAQVMGADVAASVLDLSKSEVRRMTKESTLTSSCRTSTRALVA